MRSPANGLGEKADSTRSGSIRAVGNKRKLSPRTELSAFFTVVQLAMMGVFVIQVISLQRSVAKNYSEMAADTVGALRLAYTLKQDQVDVTKNTKNTQALSVCLLQQQQQTLTSVCVNHCAAGWTWHDTASQKP
jgi:hypothetical protein